MRHEAALALAEAPDDPAALSARDGGRDPARIVAEAIERDFPGRIALVSSFGAASVVLLHMVARVDRTVPVLLLETGMLFPETLAYRDRVVERLRLTDVRNLRPDEAARRAVDPAGALHRSDVSACCALRKVAPLERGLAPFDAWITGRRRGQTASRERLPHAEHDPAGRVKINPLAAWDAAAVAGYLARHDLPEHPLVAAGYASIGCAPCTTPVAPGEDERAGRWRGLDRDECGIHFEDGRLVRTPAPARTAPLDRI